jgi:hypothetical protein
MISKLALIDVSEDASNSLGVKTDGMLLCGIQFPAAMTGSAITFDFSLDNSTWVDVKETDATDTSYTVSAGDVLRVDPSGTSFSIADLCFCQACNCTLSSSSST